MEAARLQAIIEADTGKAEGNIKSFGGKVQEAGGHVGGFIKTVGGIAGGMAVFSLVAGGISLVKDQLTDMVKSGMDANAVAAQTTAVLKSTHGAAGVTADGVEKLSGQLMNLTGIDDDTVTSTQNMLLTFTNIGAKGGVFDQATKTALDMSVALGQDTKSSAIQLGKALNDPVKGITALQRVGVTFDETQKKQIANFLKAGDTAKAQGVILTELNKEFGGSAEAAGKANGGIKILTTQFDNMKQTIGQAIIPVLTQLMGVVSSALTPILAHVGPVIKIISDRANFLWTIIKVNLAPTFAALGNLIGGTLTAVFGNFGHGSIEDGVTKAMAGLGDILRIVTAFIGDNVTPIIGKLATFIQSDVVPAVKQLAGFILNNVLPIMVQWWAFEAQHLLPIIQTMARVFMQNILPALEQVWQSISKNLIPAIERLWVKIEPAVNTILPALGFVLQNVVGPALSFVIGLVSVLIDLVAGLLDKIGGLLGKLGDFKDLIGGGLGNIGNFLGGGSGASTAGYASGGFTPGGPVLVGERGPELIMPPRGSHVFTAQETAKMLGNGSGGPSIVNNIYPAKAQFGPDELYVLNRKQALLASTGGMR